ncbi:putative Sulfur globule protein [Afipia carboxidovorans OM5]|uniref:hypothetical protein n=1 Tax=Afipia carboxidovorans TaxID=40137 RepID=UPI00017373F5|nr:hypothetical protein [Afipia carboxidovorans]ACI93460.1 putative Sulfur globule protein [Afipia carboxidovorans OM5]
MLRKLSLGLVAASALVIGMAGMSSDAAARGGHHGGGHHGGGWHHGGGHHGGWHHGGGWHRRGWGGGPRFYAGGPYYYGGYSGCYVRRLVPTPWGPRWRRINRCY